MDVGVSGPVVGYFASLVVIAIGFLLSRATPMPSSIQAAPIIGFGNSLTLNVMHSALVRLYPATPSFDLALHHPVLIAGWIGLFITSLNLIPGGQLDGGHILYALSPRLHRRLTLVLPIALILAGVFFWIGWVLWGLLLFIPAMRHPRVPSDQPLDRRRILLGAVALAILTLTFSPAPFPGTSILHYLRQSR